MGREQAGPRLRSWQGKTGGLKGITRSLRTRNYRLFWLGQVFSFSGTNAQIVALGWLVLSQTGSGAALGVVMAAQYLPMLVFAPLCGLVVDHLDRRRTLMLTQVAAGTIAAGLGVLAFKGVTPVWLLAMLAFAQGGVNSIDNPARQALLRELIKRPELTNAVALNGVMVGTGRIAGPAVAGALVAGAGIPACFFLNAASFGVMLGALGLIRPSEFNSQIDGPPHRTDFRAGLKYIAGAAEIRIGLLVMAIVGTLTYEYWVTIPVLMHNVFRASASTYASFMTVMSVGSVLGGLILASRQSAGRSGLVLGTAFLALTTGLVGLSPSLPIAFLAVALLGIGYTLFIGLSNAMLQLNTSAAYRGRVMALWSAAFIGSTTIGGPLMGWIGQQFGARQALLAGAFAALMGAVIARFAGQRSPARGEYELHLGR
jgi:MFS family permease